MARIEAALHKSPRNHWALQEAAEIYGDVDDWPDQEPVLRKTLESHPRDARALFDLSILEFHTGRCEDARSIALQLQQQHRWLTPADPSTLCYLYPVPPFRRGPAAH